LSGAIFPDVDQPLSGSGGHFEMDALLRLEDFERFVFIMCVLEHYSERDCVLLLDCSAREIREARTRALKELMNSSQMDFSQRRLFVQEEKWNDSFYAISLDQLAIVLCSWPRPSAGLASQVCLLAKNELGAGAEYQTYWRECFMLRNHEPNRNIEDLTDTEIYDAIRYLEPDPGRANGQNDDIAITDQNDDNGVVICVVLYVALLVCLAFVWFYWG
jgi:hypothetical protein